MKNRIRKNIGLLYIVVLTAVLLVILARSDELPGMIKTLGQLRVEWVWAAAGCIVLYLLARAATLQYYLRSRQCGQPFWDTLIISCIGQFYSAITPSASGGQPLQVLAMHQRGIPISIATAAVSIKFIGFQTAFMLLGGVLWGTHMHMVADQLGPVRWLVALGYLINALLIALVVLTMVNRSAVDRVVAWLIRLGQRLHLIRDREKAQAKADDMLTDYRTSLLTLTNRPMDAVVMFALSLAQVALYMVVVCCLYQAFKLQGVDWQSLLTLQLLLFITAAFVPLPGAAGAQEGGFYLFFRGVVPEGDIMAMMVCWRFFTYYLLLILGLFGVIADGVMRSVRRGKDSANGTD